jgi:hypothetical protein
MEHLVVVGLILLAVGGWCYASYVLSHIGDWAELASRFRVTNAPQGKSFYMQAGRVGAVGYRGCLTIRLATEGLYLAANPFLPIGHPPLLIPWSELHDIREKKRMFRGLVEGSVIMDVGKPTIASLSLPSWIIKQKPSIQ